MAPPNPPAKTAASSPESILGTRPDINPGAWRTPIPPSQRLGLRSVMRRPGPRWPPAGLRNPPAAEGSPEALESEPLMSLRVLVTGGSGFIGSHVVDALAERGHVPVNFDRVESPHHARGSVEHFRGDCTDVAALERAMRRCQAVVHLAAMADVNDVQADPTG